MKKFTKNGWRADGRYPLVIKHFVAYGIINSQANNRQNCYISHKILSFLVYHADRRHFHVNVKHGDKEENTSSY